MLLYCLPKQTGRHSHASYSLAETAARTSSQRRHGMPPRTNSAPEVSADPTGESRPGSSSKDVAVRTSDDNSPQHATDVGVASRRVIRERLVNLGGALDDGEQLSELLEPRA